MDSKNYNSSDYTMKVSMKAAIIKPCRRPPANAFGAVLMVLDHCLVRPNQIPAAGGGAVCGT
jgi:hypothetical protein